MKKIFIPAILLLAGLIVHPAAGGAVLADQADFWTPYQGLLDRHLSSGVREGIDLTLVDYRGVKDDPGYAEMVRRLEALSLLTLKGGDDALAFWINAYNFMAINLVIENYPVESIKDIGSIFRSVWKRPAGKIGGRDYTLHEIEHEILRKQFSEPRIHFAIVCASLSCPDLPGEVFLPGRLEEQLEKSTAAFLPHPGKGVRREGDRLLVSRIFDWFEEDFEAGGGVLAFIRSYLPELGEKDYSIGYLPYNWNLNSRLQ
ncbi:MAG: DUF547 domain-containing protein [Candidatus Erginobacter occultus]|nr:DUF547 domain-containing protein [Candidatus Erginobacter occultus]